MRRLRRDRVRCGDLGLSVHQLVPLCSGVALRAMQAISSGCCSLMRLIRREAPCGLNAAERARFNAEPNARSGCDGGQHRTCRGPKNAQPQRERLASPEHVNSSAVIGARRIQRRGLHYLSEAQPLRQEVQVRPGEAAPAGRRIAPPKGCGRHVSYLSDRFFKKSHRIKLAQAGADRTAACLNWSRSREPGNV